VKEAILDLWQLIVLVVGVGFIFMCFWGFPPERDEQPCYWELDDSRYRPKYPLPPDLDGPEK
jgi:hypothetical protein